MNYIWEVLLDLEKRDKGQVKFRLAKEGSPYMEVGLPLLNQIQIKEDTEVEINPFYRFESIFKHLYENNCSEEERVEWFQNLVTYLAKLDILSGITRESCYRKLILKETELETCKILSQREKRIIADGIIRLYRTSDCITTFTLAVRGVFPMAYLYEHREKNPDYDIYLGVMETTLNKEKFNLLKQWFLPFDLEIDVYYKHHFCIMGQEKTQIIGDIAMC